MSNPHDIGKYDDVLTSILVNEKSILGFLSSIFGFLARRTDFYHVPVGPYENMGFPPGMAEEIVIKVLRICDPNAKKPPNGARRSNDLNNDIMCSTVAQEVEVVTEEDFDEGISDSVIDVTPVEQVDNILTPGLQSVDLDSSVNVDSCIASKENVPLANDAHLSEKGARNNSKVIPDNYEPPVIPIQMNSESYNGAERETYSWSQSILDLDVTIKLPTDIKSSKDIKVTINSTDLCVCRRNGETIIRDTLPYKIKASDSIWSISEGKLLLHLEKVQERWWNKLLNSEEAIDLSKIDCSRRMDELPDEHVEKVRELQWNQERKMQGLPTSDEIRNIDILKKAWNAPGSPFAGKEFDPDMLANSSQTFTSFPNQ